MLVTCWLLVTDHQVQHEDNQGKCGLCGDAYNAKNKLFETGGAMALNYTTRIYTPGSNVTAVVELTANHGGIFKFDICYRDSFDVKGNVVCFTQFGRDFRSELS